MAKGKLVTKSVYLPKKIIERIEINKDDDDSFSSSLTKVLKLGLECQFEQNKNHLYPKNLSALEDSIQNLKSSLHSNNHEDMIDKKFEYYFSEFSSKMADEIESKLDILISECEKIIEEKFEKFREGLNKISKHIISTEESLKIIKNQMNETKNLW